MASLGAIVSVLRDPGSARALTSIAKNPKGLPKSVKVPAILLQFIIVGFHLHANWLQTSSMICYGMDLINTMQQLHAKCFTRGNYYQYTRQHRALDVLQANFAQLYPTYMLGIEVFIVSTVVLNLYMAVEFHAVRPLILAVGCAGAFCWGYGVFSSVHETSKSIMEAWSRSEHVQRSIWFRKFLRSCKPIRIPVGSLFYIDRGLVLTVMSIMVQSAASLILAEK